MRFEPLLFGNQAFHRASGSNQLAKPGGRRPVMKGKILIVEDNLQNMRLIEMTLRAGDYTLFW